MITVHGIKNCDTVKKSLKWLDNHNVAYQFRDVRAEPLSVDEVQQWLQQIDADKLVNKRSTSWRQLDEADKQLDDATKTAQLIAANPTLFKRPLVVADNGISVGFNETQWQESYL